MVEKEKRAYWEARAIFNDIVIEHTSKYQRKYGFEVSNDPKERTHNNEADAFKHTFMQAWLLIYLGEDASKIAGDWHEYIDTPNPPKGEREMDIHNNVIGRVIGKEVQAEFKKLAKHKFINKKESFDLIAEKIIQRMNKGELILKPGQKPSKPKTSYPTGFAASMPLSNAQKLKARLQKEWAQSASKRLSERETFDKADLSNYKNPATNDNRIFTQDEIDSFSRREKANHHEAIEHQRKTIGIPSKKQAERAVSSGGMVFVNGYVRGDGARVGSYYRSKPHG